MDRAEALRKGWMYSADCQEKNIGQRVWVRFQISQAREKRPGDEVVT